jgi:hypothetical protein
LRPNQSQEQTGIFIGEWVETIKLSSDVGRKIRDGTEKSRTESGSGEMYGEIREEVRSESEKKRGSCVVIWAQLITIMCSLCVYVSEVDQATNENMSCAGAVMLE